MSTYEQRISHFYSGDKRPPRLLASYTSDNLWKDQGDHGPPKLVLEKATRTGFNLVSICRVELCMGNIRRAAIAG